MKKDARTAEKFMLFAGVLTVTVLAAILFFRYLLLPLLPFFLALLLASFVSGLTKRMKRRGRISEKMLRIFLLLFFTLFFFFLCWLCIRKIGNELYRFVADEEGILEKANKLYDSAYGFLGSHFPKLAMRIDKSALFARFENLLSEMSLKASGYLAKAALNLPGVLLFVLVTFLSAYYMAVDRESLVKGFKTLLPARHRVRILKLIYALRMGFRGYLRAGGWMLLVTFLEVFAGLCLLGFGFPLLWSLFIAAVDFLPVLGTGTVLVPMAVLFFVRGNIPKGIGLLVLWGITALVRQILEPKILGKSLGIPPLCTLAASYLGLKLFGVLGLIFMPVFVSVGTGVVKELQKSAVSGEENTDFRNKNEKFDENT